MRAYRGMFAMKMERSQRQPESLNTIRIHIHRY